MTVRVYSQLGGESTIVVYAVSWEYVRACILLKLFKVKYSAPAAPRTSSRVHDLAMTA